MRGERSDAAAGPDRSEGRGGRLLCTLLDRAHELPPQLIAPLVADVVRGLGGRDPALLLQDYGQLVLAPLRGGVW